MDVFLATRPRHPWGDYGKILVHGMSTHLPRVAGVIQLERTAPFIPPITFPSIRDMVVTDEIRKRLVASGLVGGSFRPVTKRRIVRLAWEHWDKSAKEPQEFPASGEPEDFVLMRPHDENASVALGDLWEMTVESVGTARGQPPRRPGDSWEVAARLPTAPPDFFRADGFGLLLVSEKAKNWLAENAPECVDFGLVQIEA